MGAPWPPSSCSSYPHTELSFPSEPISNRFPHRHYQKLPPNHNSSPTTTIPLSPHFHLSGSTRQISSTCSIPDVSKNWVIKQPCSKLSFTKLFPEMRITKNFTSSKRRILQELQTSFKSKAMRNLSFHQLSPNQFHHPNQFIPNQLGLTSS